LTLKESFFHMVLKFLAEYGDLPILMRVYFDIQIAAKASALGMKRGLSNLRMSLIRCTASFCSATSVDVEESLYKRAQALGIAVVTISQRPALIPYHSMELRLIDGEGGWELRSIKHN
jgi:hypothetical protein